MLHLSAPLLLNGMNVRWELRLVDDVAYLQVNAFLRTFLYLRWKPPSLSPCERAILSTFHGLDKDHR